MRQLDLFEWADARPTATILDARPRFKKRVEAYIWEVVLRPNDPEPLEASVVNIFNRRDIA